MLKTIMKLHDLAERDMEDLEEECPVCPGGQKLTSSKVIKRHIIGELWNIISYLDECLIFSLHVIAGVRHYKNMEAL